MTDDETTLEGRVISPGAAFGYAVVEQLLAPLSCEAPRLGGDSVESEVGRLNHAIQEVRATLEQHVKEVHAPQDSDLQEIIAAHLQMLDDWRFFETITERIRNDRIPAEHAVERAFKVVADRLVSGGDRYLQARAEETRDLCQNIRRSLGKAHRPPLPVGSRQPAIIISSSLSATDVLRARRNNAAAFVTSSNTLTSHGAILLRSSGIPSLGAIDLEDQSIESGVPVLVDGILGKMIIRPSESTRRAVIRRSSVALRGVEDGIEPPRTVEMKSGGEIRLLCNIDHPSQAGLCLKQRLSGIGLFRTEFMVMEAGRIPSEEEQVGFYGSVLDQVGDRPVMIRTFDLGGDKTVPGLHRCNGANPALGVRGLRRHLLRHPEELKAQFRAILRAAAGHRVGILLPMVTHAGDVRAARVLLREARAELASRNERFNDEVLLGAMIEVPSAALNIAEIMPLVDLVSLGTNDLLQYLTASDRDNEEVGQYLELETSGLRSMIELIVGEARAQGRAGDVAVCGELASTVEGARLLAELGIRALSVSPLSAPAIRAALVENPENRATANPRG
jgi:phosphoenolpyruvate-protein phosphotransferase (PTS system enzyme I)